MTFSSKEIFVGGTRMCLVQGSPLDYVQGGIYTGANSRGVMGAGLPADIRRAAGAEIERELRAQSPLQVGYAYLTSSGNLAEHGVTAIAHGVVLKDPGTSSTLEISIKALLDGLRLLEDAGCRSVTIPQIGWRVTGLDQRVAADELAKVIITHVRRKSRLETITIVSQHSDYLDALSESLTDHFHRTLEDDGRELR